MALNKVEICGVNTSKLPVLKAEEKEELFRRIKEGDEEARELYIKGNLRPGPQRDQAFFQQQRKYGRSFSDWLHWAYKSN